MSDNEIDDEYNDFEDIIDENNNANKQENNDNIKNNENNLNEENNKINNNENNINNNIENNFNNNKNFINNNNNNNNKNNIDKKLDQNNNNTKSINSFYLFPQSEPSSAYNEDTVFLIQISNFEKEKQKWYEERKAQSALLQKNIELLTSLSTQVKLDFPHTYNNNNINKADTNIELNNLLTYNSKIKEIESEERILEQDKTYFEQYKSNFNSLYELREKDIEKLKLEYENEKNELEKRVELLEIEEKMIKEKENNFEKEKNILTNRYNEAMKKEALINQSKLRFENSIKELDRRNFIIQKDIEMIEEKKKFLENLQIQNNLEQKKILDEKINLNLRQDMIDTLRMKYVGDVTNNPFYNEENMNKDKYNTLNNNDFTSTINRNMGNIQNEFNFNSEYDFNKNEYNDKYLNNNINININNDQQKLSIINEDENNLKNNSDNMI